MGKKELLDITMQLHHETKPGSEEGALLVFDDGDKDRAVWLPKSQIEFTLKPKGIVEVTLPEWLALEKGLI